MTSALTEYIGLLAGGVGTFGTTVATALSDIVKNLFFVESSSGAITGVSSFAGVIAILGGVALAVKFCTWITHLIAHR